MAKGYRTGTITGKIGSDIGYTLKNSNNKVQQAWRIYQPNVNNPKTQGQAGQRMKMAPAANFYRGLATILDHSWQSVPYGNKSRQFFMKLAMDSAINFRFPFVPKGEKRFIPGEYPVSRGSLAPVSVLAVTSDSFQSSLIDNGNMDLTDSFGAWCQLLIEANPTLQANDQLTFICVYENNEGSYYPIVRRVVLDTSLIGTDNSITATNILHQQGIEVYPATGTQMIFGLGRNISEENAFEPFEDDMVAAAVIVSRKNTNGTNVVWERSNSNMAVSSAISTTWLSNTAYESALGTYMKAETNQTSDRYLNQSGNNVQSEVTIVNGQFRLGDLVNGAFAADEIYPLAVVNGNRIVGTDTVTGETHHIQLYRYLDGEFKQVTSERGNTVSWNSNSAYTLISPAEAAALLSQNGQSGTVNPAPQRPTAIWPNSYMNLTGIDLFEDENQLFNIGISAQQADGNSYFVYGGPSAVEVTLGTYVNENLYLLNQYTDEIPSTGEPASRINTIITGIVNKLRELGLRTDIPIKALAQADARNTLGVTVAEAIEIQL